MFGFRNRQARRSAVKGSTRSERAATLTEYVLFIALFILVALGGVTQLNSGARTYFSSSSSQIGRPVNHNRDAAPSTTTVGGPGGPATTAAPTTTTTVPPTTTTTTAPLVKKVSASLSLHSTSSSGSGFRVQLTGTNGAAVSNVTVTVSLYRNGTYQGQDSCTTDSGGKCQKGPYSYTRSGATWRVTAVSSTFWDGVQTSISA
ncbi:MAG: hypothetical protein GX868_10050 [Actinobacteria bacterium]|nr:hypothetical protein [Actinomycetota bacterium]